MLLEPFFLSPSYHQFFGLLPYNMLFCLSIVYQLHFLIMCLLLKNYIAMLMTFFPLKVFGCICYTSTLTNNKKKLDPRVIAYVFLGLKPHTKGYITFDLSTSAIVVLDMSFFMKIASFMPLLVSLNFFPYFLCIPILPFIIMVTIWIFLHLLSL